MRHDHHTYHLRSVRFQLTHPMRGATPAYQISSRIRQFQLTHPMWGATASIDVSVSPLSISTHTPHVGCDQKRQYTANENVNFNSHTPCGVRLHEIIYSGTYLNISTHTPHVGCDLSFWQLPNHTPISTHTPHVGCDILHRQVE